MAGMRDQSHLAEVGGPAQPGLEHVEPPARENVFRAPGREHRRANIRHGAQQDVGARDAALGEAILLEAAHIEAEREIVDAGIVGEHQEPQIVPEGLFALRPVRQAQPFLQRDLRAGFFAERRRPDENELAHAGRIARGVKTADHGAEGKADEIEFFEPERGSAFFYPWRQRVAIFADGRSIGFPAARQITGENLAALIDQCVKVARPMRPAAGAAVQQHDWFAASPAMPDHAAFAARRLVARARGFDAREIVERRNSFRQPGHRHRFHPCL